MPELSVPARTDPLRPLRAFAQVARLGSVSRAAEALGVTQPAVSLQLQALAREHGVVLLQRSGRRLVPTEAGEALLALARPLVDGIDGLGEALQARLQARAPDGLVVAAGSVALQRLLPLAVPPGVPPRVADARLHVRHAGGVAALDLLREGSIAIAVGSWLDVPGDIEFVPLLHSPARLLAPASHPLAAVERPGPADLAGHALLLPRGRKTTRQLVDLAYGRMGLPMAAVQEAEGWPAVVDLVALGQGITISTALAVDPDPRIVVRSLPGAFPARPYGFALRRGHTPGARERQFLDALRAGAEALRHPPDA